MTPAQPNTTLVHSPLLESFGLRSDVEPIRMEILSTDSFSSENDKDSGVHCDKPSSSDLTLSAPSNVQAPSSTPSICDLGDFDKNFDQLGPSIQTRKESCDTSLGSLSVAEDTQTRSEQGCLRVKPTLYTGHNWDSKIMFEYSMKEEEQDDVEMHSLTALPFEILQLIGESSFCIPAPVCW